jgi:hypothetical protein
MAAMLPPTAAPIERRGDGPEVKERADGRGADQCEAGDDAQSVKCLGALISEPALRLMSLF